jgi:hypothetical protein
MFVTQFDDLGNVYKENELLFKLSMMLPAFKASYLIESMVGAICHNIADGLAGRQPHAKGTWNAICLAHLGDTGTAFVALPQIPTRNVNWFKKGKWVHLAKIAFERYSMRKIKKRYLRAGVREVRAEGFGYRAFG